jgi:hypothetical protein
MRYFFISIHTKQRPLTRKERRKETASHWKQALKGTLYALLILFALTLVLFIISLILGKILPDSMFEGLIDPSAPFPAEESPSSVFDLRADSPCPDRLSAQTVRSGSAATPGSASAGATRAPA